MPTAQRERDGGARQREGSGETQTEERRNESLLSDAEDLGLSVLSLHSRSDDEEEARTRSTRGEDT